MAGPIKSGPSPEEKDRLRFFAGQQRQHDGRIQKCPLCGLPQVKPRLHANALSRGYGIYICDACGCLEALLSAKGRALPFREWACMRPDFRIGSDEKEADDT